MQNQCSSKFLEIWVFLDHLLSCDALHWKYSFLPRKNYPKKSAPFFSWEITTKGHNLSCSGEKFCCSLLCGLLDVVFFFSWIPHFPPCYCIQGTLLEGFQQKVILRKEYLIFVINDVDVPFFTTEQEDRCHCPFHTIPIHSTSIFL